MKRWPMLLVGLLATAFAHAQIKTPQPSPSAKLVQTVGLTEVTVEYSRPSAKDREVFGNLVPFGEMWRTGANAATKVSFGDDVLVNGEKLAKGSYALYTVPGEKEWTVMFYSNTSYWGTPGENFKEEEVAAKITVQAGKSGRKVETFTIDINNLRNSGATIDLLWADVLVSIPFEVMTDKAVMGSIERTMNGPAANDYYAAARYYFEEGKDLKQAHEWVVKANEMNPDKFWMVRQQALIEAAMGDYKTAIGTAERSTKLAEEAGNKDYVRMNEASIGEWKRKAK